MNHAEASTPDESAAKTRDHELRTAAEPAIARKLGDWQTRLLQMDRRNNLLYFRPGRGSVGLIDTTPDQLDRRLESSRKGLTFPYAEPKRSRRRGFAAAIDNPNNDDTDTGEAPAFIEGDLRTDCEPVDLQRRLRNLQRRDREWEEEQGLSILFIAAGFLDWIDEQGQPARAPLVLIPADLHRESLREAFRLRSRDDEPTVNPTLRHQLEQFGITLPEFEDVSGGGNESLESFIDAVQGLVRQRRGWSVDHSLVLGGFSFSKLAMYEDLSRMREQGVKSDLIRQMALPADTAMDYGVSRATPADTDLSGGGLDDILDVRDQFVVMPADFSQLRAIEEARKGANLVIHGPPGTGKSQTITNLIASLLADGKRVLFVSEKTAALDVVKRRLEESDLGVFCLDLHSDRGRKQQVYEQLRRSVHDGREQVASPLFLNALIESRDLLNTNVRLLHRAQNPLELSVYEVQARFASLQDLPRCDELNVPSASQMTSEWVRTTVGLAERLAHRPAEFHSHTSSRWLPLRTPQSSLQLADLVREDMRSVSEAVMALKTSTEPHRKWLGLPAIESLEDARNLGELLKVFEHAPGVPEPWLSRRTLTRLRRHAQNQAIQQTTRNTLTQKLLNWLGDDWATPDYRAIGAESELSASERQLIVAMLGNGWDAAFAQNPEALSAAVTDYKGALDALLACAEEIGTLLGGAELRTLGQIVEASDLAKRVLALESVPEAWLASRALRDIDQEIETARALVADLQQAEEELAESFSETLVDRVDEELVIRFRTDHQSFLRRLFGSAYRTDQRLLLGLTTSKGKLTVQEGLEAVESALDVQRQRRLWSETEESLQRQLSDRVRGRQTDWEGVEDDIFALRDIQSRWNQGSDELHELLAEEAGEAGRRRLAQSQAVLEEAIEVYNRAAAQFEHEPLTDLDFQPTLGGELLDQALVPLFRLKNCTAALYSSLSRPFSTWDELVESIGCGVKLTEVLEEDRRLAPKLSEDFGVYFDGMNTDWDVLNSALTWTDEYLNLAKQRRSQRLRRHAVEPVQRDEYRERHRSVESALDTFLNTLPRLDLRFDRSATDWESWDSPEFDQLQAWIDDMAAHADEAPQWAEYQDAVGALAQRMGEGAVEAIRARSDQAEKVPGIVSRRIYESWLEDMYEVHPELRHFNRVDHEQIRSRFRQIDQDVPCAARQRVRDRVFKKYPEHGVTSLQAGQWGLLAGELSKQRRQLSVRRLIERIPNLLQTLKPCFLMSPLAVSQYLPGGPLQSDRIEFDAVIFDEASQVWPEDALPAIERARQVIVSGDRQQLPPSNFFRSAGEDDEDADRDDDEASDAFEGRESILDVMIGQLGRGVAERTLSVHYRSRCEGLIRFSNHAFYDNRLLTFPGPTSEESCVKDVFLPDATYSAGSTRQNRGEAERVTEIVFDLLETVPPDESVGVVALSRAQAELIENLIEARRQQDTHLDDRFSKERDEHFFVKNLENVQGDERDHMIFSIGYGPTPTGAVPNRFGPLNRDGGERRLNVAVTRARQSMTVVHSLSPDQIRSSAAGARQLRRYLEYVRNPTFALEAEVTGTAEPDSPFEEAVLAALRSRGHRVESQVGVSGYRIDLAIQSEDGKMFDLGVECDGATYHSSPAARDRDWLRQQVLEGLGWRIHRVWSTAWIRNPEAELVAIEEALAQARTKPPDPPASSSVNNKSVSNEMRQDEKSSQPLTAPVDASGPPLLFPEYSRHQPKAETADPLTVPTGYLASLMGRMVQQEQPMHVDMLVERLREAFAVRRVGSKIRSRIDAGLTQAIQTGSLVRDTSGFLQVTREINPLTPRRDPGRKIGLVADAELDAGLLIVAKATFGAARADLIRETARQFGYRRTGTEIAARLDVRVEQLIQRGELIQQSDTMVAKD